MTTQFEQAIEVQSALRAHDILSEAIIEWAHHRARVPDLVKLADENPEVVNTHTRLELYVWFHRPGTVTWNEGTDRERVEWGPHGGGAPGIGGDTAIRISFTSEWASPADIIDFLVTTVLRGRRAWDASRPQVKQQEAAVHAVAIFLEGDFDDFVVFATKAERDAFEQGVSKAYSYGAGSAATYSWPEEADDIRKELGDDAVARVERVAADADANS